MINKFLRQHVLESLDNTLLCSTSHDFFTNNENIKKQIKFLESKFISSRTSTDNVQFVEYIKFIIKYKNIDCDFNFGIKTDDIDMFMAIVLFLDSLVFAYEDQYQNLFKKFKPILVSLLTDISDYITSYKYTSVHPDETNIKILNFLYFIYTNTDNKILIYLTEKDKDICLKNLSTRLLIVLNKYKYLDKNLKEYYHLLVRNINILKMIVQKDNEFENDNFLYWGDFRKLISDITKYTIKSFPNKCEKLQCNFKYAYNTVTENNETQRILKTQIVKLQRFIEQKKREDAKKEKEKLEKEKQQSELANFSNNSNIAILNDTGVLTNSLSNHFDTIENDIEKLKNKCIQRKIKIHGGQ